MRISPKHRKKLFDFLKQFYKRYPDERHTLFHFVRYFKDRLKNNKDAWMGVSGETGVGKSLFVIMSMILFGRPMTLTDNVSYIPKGQEIMNKFDKLSFQCFLVDEGAREMRSVNWQSKQQQGVNVKAMTDRFKNNWTFINLPNFNEFTKSMRNTNLIFRAVVLYRTDLYARVVIQRKSRNWRSDDPWGDKRANEIYEKVMKKYGELSNDRILGIERSMHNTIMDFIVPNLEVILPDVVQEYERLKDESRNQAKEEGEIVAEKKNLYKDKYEELLKKVSRILVNNELQLGELNPTRDDIASSIGISKNTLAKYLKMPKEEQIQRPKFQ